MIRIPLCLLLASASLILTSCGTQVREEERKPAPEPPGEVVIPVSEQAGTIRTEVAEKRETPNVIRVPGLIALPDNGKWRVGAITSGRIERVLVNQGDYVQAGQILARMHSHDVHEAKAAYFTAMTDKA